MNKFFKYTFIALLGVLTLGLSSCTDEYEYTPTSKTELGGNAFLVSDGSTAISYLPTAEQSFTFKVSRIDSTEAQTVGLSSSNEKFTVPATVSFAAGQKTAEVKVSFDIATGTSEKLVSPSLMQRSITMLQPYLIIPSPVISLTLVHT